MSSYHSSFTYLGINSAKDKKLRIASFNPDNGEYDTFLSMTPVTEDYYDGTKKFDYGARFDSAATISITLVKPDGSDFSLAENRDLLRWLTGVRTNSWLDFCIGHNLVMYSFFGRVTDVKQQKLDARIIGLVITFQSIHPWAYSSIIEKQFSIRSDGFKITEDGVVYYNNTRPQFGIDSESGVVYINNNGKEDTFDITDYGVIYKIQDTVVELDNPSDDLYTYTYLDVEYRNTLDKDITSSLTIKNMDLDEETSIINITQGEIIKLNSGQFIISDKPNKIFGDSFNFVWPRLKPGINKISVNGSGAGEIIFKYRYPIKVGDCAVDIENIINNPVLCDIITNSGGDDSMANMTMRIQDGYLQYSLDGNTWNNAIEISQLAVATGAYITTTVDDSGMLEIGVDEAEQ